MAAVKKLSNMLAGPKWKCTKCDQDNVISTIKCEGCAQDATGKVLWNIHRLVALGNVEKDVMIFSPENLVVACGECRAPMDYVSYSH